MYLVKEVSVVSIRIIQVMGWFHSMCSTLSSVFFFFFK